MGYADKYALVVSHIMNRNPYGIYRDSRRIRRLSTFSLLYPDPRQDFGSASPLFSGCTSLSAFLPRRVSGEQRGGAAEILSRIGVEQGERIQLRIRRLLGGHLVEL